MFRIMSFKRISSLFARRMLGDSYSLQLVAYRPELSYGRGVPHD